MCSSYSKICQYRTWKNTQFQLNSLTWTACQRYRENHNIRPDLYTHLCGEPILALSWRSKWALSWWSSSWSFKILPKETVTTSYQMLGLWPATLADDPDGQHDWRTYPIGEQSFAVPGRLIQSVNPTTSKTHFSIPFYLLQSTVLVALTASLFQSLTMSDLKMVPKLALTKEYPYRQGSGESSITQEF